MNFKSLQTRGGPKTLPKRDARYGTFQGVAVGSVFTGHPAPRSARHVLSGDCVRFGVGEHRASEGVTRLTQSSSDGVTVIAARSNPFKVRGPVVTFEAVDVVHVRVPEGRAWTENLRDEAVDVVHRTHPIQTQHQHRVWGARAAGARESNTPFTPPTRAVGARQPSDTPQIANFVRRAVARVVHGEPVFHANTLVVIRPQSTGY